MTWPLWFLAFMCGALAWPAIRLLLEFFKQMRELWNSLDYYELPENVDSLTWFGRGAHWAMRTLKRRAP